ncbi:MAG TPA: DNA recombination protein RmuC [Steroidobacteraceae bacterium]|nr:DNA recombination protein RmuC [Steroidobacteraceae bacterium]
MTMGFVAGVAGCALAGGIVLGMLIAQLRAARGTQALAVELERARARLEAQIEQRTDRAAFAHESEARLRSAFDSLAHRALQEREAAMAQLIAPLKEALQRAESQAQAFERERRDVLGQLRSQIETLASGQAQLSRETRNLVTALRRPEVRGRWGELTLRRVVELAGMSEHCDFTEQLHVAGDQGGLRPDLVVHMPESRDLVVDVKTPLDAYLEALEAPSEETRQAALRRHAQQVESRVRELASKGYWAQFERSPDFAVLFLPGDQFLAAALAERPELLENALKQSVIIATPSTLMALLKAVAYGWRQSLAAENAAAIRTLGEELYRRLGTFAGHLNRLGQRLGAAVEAYNGAVGSLERQVLPQARRFPELGVTADAPLESLDPIEELIRRTSAATGVEPAASDAREA